MQFTRNSIYTLTVLSNLLGGMGRRETCLFANIKSALNRLLSFRVLVFLLFVELYQSTEHYKRIDVKTLFSPLSINPYFETNI